MTFSIHCPRCKQEFSAGDAETLADQLMEHVLAAHDHQPPRDHVLARIARHNPSSGD